MKESKDLSDDDKASLHSALHASDQIRLMERLFRNLKTEWVPGLGYGCESEAKKDLSFYLMDYYNWVRPHTFNEGVPPAKAENRSKPLSGFC